jgi:hypothetical protein
MTLMGPVKAEMLLAGTERLCAAAAAGVLDGVLVGVLVGSTEVLVGVPVGGTEVLVGVLVSELVGVLVAGTERLPAAARTTVAARLGKETAMIGSRGQHIAGRFS